MPTPESTPAAMAAERYLREETAFRLGALLTESPHPKTMTLGESLRADLPAGLKQLLSVDEDIAPAARRVMALEAAFPRLRAAMVRTLRHGGRIHFTGCGATGRLSILLEAMWRTFWQDFTRRHPEHTTLANDMEDRVRSVMAGGDFALIKSVEGFEDFAAFGREQLRESGLSAGDLVVAVTEGGETPFVIGTAWEGVAAGAAVFFVFNNPADLLRHHVKRSREILDDPRINSLDLTTGPMAVTGSTRMQATSSELLVLGAALELALADLFVERLGSAAPALPGASVPGIGVYLTRFSALQAALAADAGIAFLARLVELEESVYARHGRVTYLAGAGLLDILTDTTERSPTFMIPPFRMDDDTTSPVSWAFVKHPLLATAPAWETMLARPLRGVSWTAETYTKLDAPESLQQRPPLLTAERIRKFRIGNEHDPSRTEADDSALILLLTAADARQADLLRQAFQREAPAYRRHAIWIMDGTVHPVFENALTLPWTPPDSPLRLWTHLAVKLVMNTVSTATLGRLGRLRGNGMVWVNPSNKKLVDRGTRLVAQQTGLDYTAACHALHAAMENVRDLQNAGKEAPSPVALAIETHRTKAAESYPVL